MTKINKAKVIDAALIVIADMGVDKLSMRNVAQQLDVSQMAAYKHVRDKDELLSLCLEEFIRRANVLPKASLPWDRWILTLGRNMYHALADDITWVPVLGSLRLGSEAMHVSDVFREKLTAAGFSKAQTLQAYLAMIQCVIGAVCLKASFASQEHQLGSDFKKEQIDMALPLLVLGLKSKLST